MLQCRAGVAPDFANTLQLQRTGLSVLPPAAALDALAAVMLAAWQRPSHASPVAVARVDWNAIEMQVSTTKRLTTCTTCIVLSHRQQLVYCALLRLPDARCATGHEPP